MNIITKSVSFSFPATLALQQTVLLAYPDFSLAGIRSLRSLKKTIKNADSQIVTDDEKQVEIEFVNDTTNNVSLCIVSKCTEDARIANTVNAILNQLSGKTVYILSAIHLPRANAQDKVAFYYGSAAPAASGVTFKPIDAKLETKDKFLNTFLHLSALHAVQVTVLFVPGFAYVPKSRRPSHVDDGTLQVTKNLNAVVSAILSKASLSLEELEKNIPTIQNDDDLFPQTEASLYI